MLHDPNISQKFNERRILFHNLIGHIIAIVIVAGFFVMAFISLMGFVDITDPAITAFVGTVLGYAIGKFDPLLSYYFNWNPTAELSRRESREEGKSGLSS